MVAFYDLDKTNPTAVRACHGCRQGMWNLKRAEREEDVQVPGNAAAQSDLDARLTLGKLLLDVHWVAAYRIKSAISYECTQHILANGSEPVLSVFMIRE